MTGLGKSQVASQASRRPAPAPLTTQATSSQISFRNSLPRRLERMAYQSQASVAIPTHPATVAGYTSLSLNGSEYLVVRAAQASVTRNASTIDGSTQQTTNPPSLDHRLSANSR